MLAGRDEAASWQVVGEDGRVADVLVLSFSPIASDARVLKQVELLREQHSVTTCGYGPAPEGVARHIEIPMSAASTALNGRLITARAYLAAYASMPAVAAARRLLRPEKACFDVVLANDVEAVPIGLWLRPRAGVHADLHEYSPKLHDENPAWRRRIAPFYRWICHRFVVKADSATTVGHGLADAYREDFGIDAEIVTNAAPFAELTPSEVADDGALRLVHSGAALRNRHLEVLLDAVASSSADVSLDLLLMANDPAYIDELRERASERVRVLDPVPYAELVATLNAYDLGVHILPPVNFNNANALPNKIFDYVQARLGLIVGPTPEMAALAREHGVGVVTEDFTAEALAAVLDSLDAARVRELKAASHAAARELSAEVAVQGWARAIDALVAGAQR